MDFSLCIINPTSSWGESGVKTPTISKRAPNIHHSLAMLHSRNPMADLYNIQSRLKSQVEKNAIFTNYPDVSIDPKT